MSNSVCERCGGTIIKSYDDVICVNCGYLPGQDAELLYKWVKKRGRYVPRKVIKHATLAGIPPVGKATLPKPAPGIGTPRAGNTKKAVIL